MLTLLNIVKITLSLLMIIFGVRIFRYAAKTKRLKAEYQGRTKRVEDATKLAERGMINLMIEETKSFQKVEKELRQTEIEYEFNSNLLAGCVIVLAALEILLTTSTFIKR